MQTSSSATARREPSARQSSASRETVTSACTDVPAADVAPTTALNSPEAASASSTTPFMSAAGSAAYSL